MSHWNYKHDASTNGLANVDYPHHEIHAGSAYEYCDIQTVGNGSFLHYLIETPNTDEEQHLTFVITGSAITTVEAFKTSTRVGNSSVVAAVNNMNHRSVNTTNLTDLDNGITAAGADGTRFYCKHGGAAAGAFRASNETASRQERILAKAAKTYFKIESGTNGNLVSVHFEWYEHTPLA